MAKSQRKLVWFSYGAASAVAWYLAKKEYSNVLAVNCDTSANEHPDNKRFKEDVERWVGDKVVVISNPDYSTVEEVAEKTRYMAGISGARCTVELKKIPRFNFQRPDDIHIFGLTSDEHKRIGQFKNNHPDLYLDFILQRYDVTKEDCFSFLVDAGIELPAMYKLGFKNNNCIGCYKATSAAYWNKVRMHFPEVFETRCRQSRELGVKLTRYKGEGIYLDQLPEDYMIDKKIIEDLSCGPQCK